ncbi:MAG: aldo/keto reductase [Candidatus Aminicenantes bacterium]|nr:MAG: aldo/keto reductase [Candidatus Aminicenantes bacterium]
MSFEQLSIDAKVVLNNGIEMPVFGLGTYLSGTSQETQEIVLHALEIGYRHIDTARFYGNERDIGIAIKKSGIPRDEIFVTTKLWNSDHGFNRALEAFEESLEDLGLDYVDLYLIHWPVQGLRNESWRALEKLQVEGKCRAIGVSNYTIGHLKELLDISPVMPAVNQVEFSPFLYQKDLLEFCRSNNIQFESYSPLTKGHMLDDPRLSEIAQEYAKSVAQILIRWTLQKGVIVIPKSSRKERIRENADVFDFVITPEDMDRLDALHENLRVSWDPTTIS